MLGPEMKSVSFALSAASDESEVIGRRRSPPSLEAPRKARTIVMQASAASSARAIDGKSISLGW